MREPLLEVNLTAGYRDRTVLHELRLSLQAGERLGLVGTSGAGKSTLLLALLGLLPWKQGWARGEVRVAGVNLLTLPEREARRLRGRVLALVPQSPMSALNNALSLQVHFREAWRAHEAADPLRLARRIQALLQRVRLPTDAAFLQRKPGELSVGQAQRCVLALALLHRPAVLIADEPTSALDPGTQVDVLALMREVNEEDGTALLFVSHDLLSVFRLCERVALLCEGRVAESLAIEQLALAEHPALRHLLHALPVPPELLLQHMRAPLAASDRQLFGTKVMTPGS